MELQDPKMNGAIPASAVGLVRGPRGWGQESGLPSHQPLYLSSPATGKNARASCPATVLSWKEASLVYGCE